MVTALRFRTNEAIKAQKHSHKKIESIVIMRGDSFCCAVCSGGWIIS